MGRPQKTRNVFAMEDHLLVDCDEFAVDTSFVIDALKPDEKRHAVASACLRSLIASGATMHYSELVTVELMDSSIEISLRGHVRKRNDPRRYDRRVRRRTYPAVLALEGGWWELRQAIPHVEVCVSELWEMAGYMIEDYGLRSFDAYHAATALLADVPILTFDTDFARVAGGLTVYTAADLVPQCRRLRSRMPAYRYASEP